MKLDPATIWSAHLRQMVDPDRVVASLGHSVDLALVISIEGKVLRAQINPNSRLQLSVSRWEGLPLTLQLKTDARGTFLEKLRAFLAADCTITDPFELCHSATPAQSAFQMEYQLHPLEGSEDFLLLGRDLHPVAELRSNLAAAEIAVDQEASKRRERETQLGTLLAATQEGTLFVSVDTGRVTDCNLAAMVVLGLGRDAVIGSSISDLISSDLGTDLMPLILEAARAQTGAGMSVRVSDAKTVLIRPTLFRSNAGRMVLCLISEERSPQTGTEEAGGCLQALFENSVEGTVFVTQKGRILRGNNAFFKLTGLFSGAAARGRALSDFMARRSVDFEVLRDNTLRHGSMQCYATSLISEVGVETPVEISTTLLHKELEPVLALTIRDVSRNQIIGPSRGHAEDQELEWLGAQVGRQSLKDIVQEAVDRLEKKCIKLAIEQSSDNRASAAQLLGMSRQSLYVKLRKFGLSQKG